MINKRKVAELMRKGGKRPSKEALAEIENIVSIKIEELFEKAKRKADFAGRKTIFKEDLE